MGRQHVSAWLQKRDIPPRTANPPRSGRCEPVLRVVKRPCCSRHFAARCFSEVRIMSAMARTALANLAFVSLLSLVSIGYLHAKASPQALGKELRAAVSNVCRQVCSNSRLMMQGYDLSNAVAQEFKAGISVAEAVDILRDAGFRTTGKPATLTAQTMKRPDAGWIYASLDLSPPALFHACRETAAVELVPAISSDQVESVAKVHATITGVCL